MKDDITASLSAFNFLLEPHLGDEMDLTQSFLNFLTTRVFNSLCEGSQNLGAGMELGTDDEGKAKLCEIGGIQSLEFFVFDIAQAVESQPRLLLGGFLRQLARPGEFAAQVGMSSDECKLGFIAAVFDNRSQGKGEVLAIGEGLFLIRFFCDPRGMFVDGAKQADELELGHLVQICEGGQTGRMCEAVHGFT